MSSCSRSIPSGEAFGANPVRHAEALFARILEQEGARLPSGRRYAARQRTPTEGIAIPEASTTPSRLSATPDPAGQALKLNAEFAMSELCG